MAFLKMKKGEFRITRSILDKKTFDEWIKKEGSLALEQELDRTRVRWFFGRHRATRRLYKSARLALHHEGRFCTKVKPRLDHLPVVIRKIGILIKTRGYKDLYSADSSKALVVIPRGIVQNDFCQYLTDELAKARELEPFRGLSLRVLKDVALEAETLFFKHFAKGRQHIDSSGKGAILGVDTDFSWRLNRVDGHYFYGYAGKEGHDLKKRGELRQFRSEMEEILHGQQVYLKRLRGDEVAAIADSFRTPVGV